MIKVYTVKNNYDIHVPVIYICHNQRIKTILISSFIILMYCKPTFLRDNFILRFTGDELVCGYLFFDQALSTPMLFLHPNTKDWIAARNFRDEAFMNLTKNLSHTNKSWFTVNHNVHEHTLIIGIGFVSNWCIILLHINPETLIKVIFLYVKLSLKM